MKSPRYMYPDVSSYVSRVTSRKRIRYMYLDVSYVYPECILDSFEIRVKYMQNVKIHVFSWNLTEHVRYVRDTSRYIRIRVSCRIHAGYIRIRILITNPPKLDNNPPLTLRATGEDTARRSLDSSTARQPGLKRAPTFLVRPPCGDEPDD